MEPTAPTPKRDPSALYVFATLLIFAAFFGTWFLIKARYPDSPNTKPYLYTPPSPMPDNEFKQTIDEYRNLRKIAHPSRAQYETMQKDINRISQSKPDLITGYNNDGNALGLVGETPHQQILAGQVDVRTLDTAPPPTKTEISPINLTWHRVTQFGGRSVKNTPNFTIKGDMWRIHWKTEAGEYDGNFSITLYNADGSYKEIAANLTGSGEDTTIERGAGTYYLNISSTQVYGVVVEEYR